MATRKSAARSKKRKAAKGSEGARLLRNWRKDYGYTQRLAAEMFGLWPNSYAILESGRRVPTLPVAITAENVAGIKPRLWLQVD